MSQPDQDPPAAPGLVERVQAALDDGGGSGAQAGGRAGLTVEGAPRTRRTTWWDTPDWRLHRAGVALALDHARGRTSPPRLLLVSASREPVLTELESASHPQATRIAPSRGPVMPADLPPGEVASAVTRVASLRALLPLVTVSHVERVARALDGDGKTIARLRLVEPVAGLAVPAAARYARGGVGQARPALLGPGRVELEALRGYVREAAVLARRLEQAGIAVVSVLPGAASDPALPPAPPRPDDVTRLLRAAGLDPGRRLPRREAGLSPSAPAPAAVATMLLSFLDDVAVNEQGVIDDVDTEFLHDLRIAVRRSRSAVKVAADVLPEELVAAFAPRLKWMGDVTTPLRDLDVHLLDLPAAASRPQACAPGDLAPFAAFLAQRRDAERRRLARTLRTPAWRRLCEEWRAALEPLAAGVGGDGSAPASGVLAADKVARADRRVTRLGAAITPASPADDLHTLRKRTKELRYVLELFSPVLDPAAVSALVGDLKGFQDVLGRFQDAEVQRDAVTALAHDMAAEARRTGHDVPIDALLALGELAGQLAVDQAAARAAFEGRFGAYLGPGARAHVDALTGRRPDGADRRREGKGGGK